MSQWGLDSTLFLTTRLPAQAPAEEVACVVCANSASDDLSETLCVIDVNPTSCAYGEIIARIELDQPDALRRTRSRRQSDTAMQGRGATAGPELAQRIAPRVVLAHDASCPYGFVSSGFSAHNVSSTISIWRRYDGPDAATPWALRKVITMADEPHRSGQLPGVLRPSGAVPALVADIALSPDDRFLYVACWGSGELKQFDVANPLRPREVASVRVGGLVARAAHPSRALRLAGGPAAVTVSRDGRRIYVTNSLSRSWDARLYPEGLQGWLVKLDADPTGGLTFDPNFFVDFGEQRPYRVRLPDQGES